MKDVVERALARWGMRDPSPDDVLMEECPEYHVSDGDTVLYHSLASQVIERAVAHGMLAGGRRARCLHCNKRLGKGKRYYCDRGCTSSYQAELKKKPRYCTVCGTVIPRRPTQTYSNYSTRMYCSMDCQMQGRRKVTSDVKREIEMMYAAGVSVKEISERLSYHRATIYAALKR